MVAFATLWRVSSEAARSLATWSSPEPLGHDMTIVMRLPASVGSRAASGTRSTAGKEPRGSSAA
jgi:hypothetical protein